MARHLALAFLALAPCRFAYAQSVPPTDPFGRLRNGGGSPYLVPPDAVAPPTEGTATGVNPSHTVELSRWTTPDSGRAWYGWQTLIVDGAAAATFLSGVAVRHVGSSDIYLDASVGCYFSAVSGYALGGPIIHWAHGRAGKGFASLGMRVGFPIVLGLIGFALVGQRGDFDEDMTGIGAGLTLGALGAAGLDAGLLAYEPARPGAPAVTFAPRLMVGREHSSITLMGQF